MEEGGRHTVKQGDGEAKNAEAKGTQHGVTRGRILHTRAICA
jgi:hypothetical protein